MWADRAEELADWTLARLVNRTDVYGAYRSERQVIAINRAIKRKGGSKLVGILTTARNLTRDRIIRHYRGTGRTDIIGTHASAPDNTTFWGGWDIDNKDKNKRTHRENSRDAKSLHAWLVRDGFHPLLTKSGGGSYHLRVLFSSPAPADEVREFLEGFDMATEVFPKTNDVRRTPKQIGNWLRLPGRHHNRDYWSKVWDGSKWLEDSDAVSFILALVGDDPALIGCKAATTAPPDEDLFTAPLPSSFPDGKGYKTAARKKHTSYIPNLVSPLLVSPSRIPSELCKAQWGHVADLASMYVPDAKEKRNRKSFRFAQAFKRLAADAGDADLKRAFDLWWVHAEPVVGTKEYGYNLSEFKRQYAACRNPGGFHWLELAELGKRDRLPAEVRKLCRTKEKRRLLRTVARGQRWVGPTEFSLSCRQAATIMWGKTEDRKAMRRNDKRAHKVLLRFDQEGVLRRVAIGQTWKDAGKGMAKATTWRYLPMWTKEGEFRPEVK